MRNHRGRCAPIRVARRWLRSQRVEAPGRGGRSAAAWRPGLAAARSAPRGGCAPERGVPEHASTKNAAEPGQSQNDSATARHAANARTRGRDARTREARRACHSRGSPQRRRALLRSRPTATPGFRWSRTERSPWPGQARWTWRPPFEVASRDPSRGCASPRSRPPPGTFASGATSLIGRGIVLIWRAITTIASSSVKGGPASEHLIEDHPERVQIAPSVERLALGLLGGHVPRRSEDRACLRFDGVHRLVVRAEHLCDSEVEHLDDLFVRLVRAEPREEQVVRLQVAVDDPLVVGLGERTQRLPRRVEGRGSVETSRRASGADRATRLRAAPSRDRTRPCRSVPKSKTVTVLGDVRRLLARASRRNRRTTRLVEGTFAAQDLDGDLSTDRRLLRAIDRSHRARRRAATAP